MPRVSRTWSYEASKRRYVANINKEKVELLKGVDRTSENNEEADRLYDRVKAVLTVHTLGDRSPIRTSLDAWLRWLRDRPHNPVAPNTLTMYQDFVASFAERHGEVLGREVTVWHLEDWLMAMRQERRHPTTGVPIRWGDSTVRSAVKTMRSAFLYCASRGLVTRDPFAGPDAASLLAGAGLVFEGKKVAIEEDEYHLLMRRALTRSSKDWAILLMLLYHTGARPSELLAARVDEWNPAKKVFVIQAADPANVGRFKLRRLRRDRVVLVPDQLVPFVEVLVEKARALPGFPANAHAILEAHHQHQPLPPPLRKAQFLFHAERNCRKTPVLGDNPGPPPMTVRTFNARLKGCIQRINEEAETELVRPELTSYSFRHGFVTRWVTTKRRNGELGGELAILARLLGTSIAMIERFYSHLFTKHDVLRDCLNDFVNDGH